MSRFRGSSEFEELSAEGADHIGLEPALAFVKRRRGRPGRSGRRTFLLGLHIDAAAVFKAARLAHYIGRGDTVGSSVARRQAPLASGNYARPPQVDRAGGIFRRVAGAAGDVVHLLASAFEPLPEALKGFVDKLSDGPERTRRGLLWNGCRCSNRRLGLSARCFLAPTGPSAMSMQTSTERESGRVREKHDRNRSMTSRPRRLSLLRIAIVLARIWQRTVKTGRAPPRCRLAAQAR